MVLVSVILPCKNEEKTIGRCIQAAKASLSGSWFTYEILVVDNNSTDRSAEEARKNGAKVITETIPGYGSALKKGFALAKGDYLLMGDSDLTYPFAMSHEFIQKHQEGYMLVMGRRKPEKGAMPFLHRYLGNPFLSFLTRLLFKTKVRDVHCGMRSIRNDAYHKLAMKENGMEFAPEMIIKAALKGYTTFQLDIPYKKRSGSESKLKTFHNGYKHLLYLLNTFYTYKRRGSI